MRCHNEYILSIQERGHALFLGNWHLQNPCQEKDFPQLDIALKLVREQAYLWILGKKHIFLLQTTDYKDKLSLYHRESWAKPIIITMMASCRGGGDAGGVAMVSTSRLTTLSAADTATR